MLFWRGALEEEIGLKKYLRLNKYVDEYTILAQDVNNIFM